MKIHIIRVPDREGAEKTFEKVMARNVPNLMKDINLYIQEAQQTSSRRKSETHTETHKSQTVKRLKTIEAAREKYFLTYKTSSVRLIAISFSSKTIEARSQ